MDQTRLELAQGALLRLKELEERTSLMRIRLALQAAQGVLHEIIYYEEHEKEPCHAD